MNSQLLGIFFKTNMTQSVELIFYDQKTRKCGNFLSNLVGLKCKNIYYITLSSDSQFRAKVKLPAIKCTAL